MLKDLGPRMVGFFVKVVDKLISLFRKDHREIVLNSTCKALEGGNDTAVYRFVPKQFYDVPYISKLNNCTQFAIVMQGPVCIDEDITYNTIKFYKKIYPNAKIILSTWESESEEQIEKIKKEGVVVVKSKKPEYSGFKNVNLQLVNSLNGIRVAKDFGFSYVVKTRTDQRICKAYSLDFMINALNAFPGNDSQNKRIVLLSTMSGNMFTPYFMSDFLYAGNVEDMIKLFSAPLDNRTQFDIPPDLTRRQASENLYAPEIYILKHYLSGKIGYNCEDTVKAYWQAVKKYFICLSMKDIGLLWTKYDLSHELNFYYSEYFGAMDSEESMAILNFDFINWFNLYNGITQYQEDFEKYADARMNIKIK